ncbi:uroplakin-3b-like [Protopterus annectens]|uniref:uroplakin-3b-like n=1 Tax=Protopterus annectens TaxID=7888 RepID=UPI001CF98EF8|nr:uroplakin-3b-like [Protopterus annectens]
MIAVEELMQATSKNKIPINYTPEIIQNDILGKITASTFALKQPLCAFQDTKKDCRDCNIWVAVATMKGAVSKINIIAATYPNFPNIYPAFLTLSTPINQFDCNDLGQSVIRALRVGADNACQNDVTATSCNGPLPSDPGAYRVRYYLQHPNGTFLAKTTWSQPIALTKVF